MKIRYGSFLKKYREEAKLTQRKLAEMIGMGFKRQRISDWETGLSCPNPEQKKTIAKFLGAQEKDLFTWGILDFEGIKVLCNPTVDELNKLLTQQYRRK